jgi:hypothetical protein
MFLQLEKGDSLKERFFMSSTPFKHILMEAGKKGSPEHAE